MGTPEVITTESIGSLSTGCCLLHHHFGYGLGPAPGSNAARSTSRQSSGITLLQAPPLLSSRPGTIPLHPYDSSVHLRSLLGVDSGGIVAGAAPRLLTVGAPVQTRAGRHQVGQSSPFPIQPTGPLRDDVGAKLVWRRLPDERSRRCVEAYRPAPR
jgi:hypothetical protein